MSALRGLTKSPLLRRDFTPSLHLYCIRRFHLEVNDSYIRSHSITHVFPSLRFTLPPIITSIIPIATGIWDSILRAVPKKKTSHSKKRKRQLVGKALQDKTNLTRCESCGDWRLLHTLCASCVKSIQKDWRRREQLGEWFMLCKVKRYKVHIYTNAVAGEYRTVYKHLSLLIHPYNAKSARLKNWIPLSLKKVENWTGPCSQTPAHRDQNIVFDSPHPMVKAVTRSNLWHLPLCSIEPFQVPEYWDYH